MSRLKHFLLPGLILGMASGAALAASPEQTDPQSPDIVGTLERDQRKCPSPLCGGYWLTPVNGGKTIYVSGVDTLAIDDSALARVLVRGQLSEAEPVHHTSVLLVSQVYGTREALTPGQNFTFVTSFPRVPPRNCVVAPCPNLLGRILNQGTIQEFDRFEFKGFPSTFTQTMLEKMALAADSIEAGTFVKGTVKYPGGYETIFEVSAIYEPIDWTRQP